ncbi:MAG: tyrosine-type recombinase/integrase [Bacteroidetes bacterium]|nr:tyrosine-type recombinase/integrase [Bacteroidota bacterium]
MNLEFFFVEEFITHLRAVRRLSSHTQRAYRSDLLSLLANLQSEGVLHPESIEVAHLRSWMSHLMEGGNSPRSIHRKLAAVRTWLDYLIYERKLINKNPAELLLPPKRARNLIEVNDEASLKQLLHNFDEAIPDVQFRMLPVLSLYLTGLRVSELAALRISDWDRAAGQIRVLGKGGKQRLVPVHPWLAQHWSRLLFLEEREGAAPLLMNDQGKAYHVRSLHRLVKAELGAVRARGRLSPHTLRHSFATHMLDEGAELLAIKDLLGHANLSATQIYTRSSLDKLKRLHKLLHPRSDNDA